MHNEIVSAVIVGLLVSVLVWLSLPKNAVDGQTGNRIKVSAVVIKSFVLASFVAYAMFYFLGDPGTDDVLSNVIGGEPDF